MADKKKSTLQPPPKREPGVLTGVEYYKRGRVRLADNERTSVKALITKISRQDEAARREEVVSTWKKHLYDRGLQHLLPVRNGWQLPALGSGYNPQDEYSRSMFTANIYNPFMQFVVAVLTREVPTVQWEPDDADNDVDITTAEGAERLEKRIDQDNHLKTKMEELGRYLWLDGRSLALTTYQLDGQRFGFKEPDDEEEDETVPEDEHAIDEEEDETIPETEESAGKEDESAGEAGEEDGEDRDGVDSEGNTEGLGRVSKPIGAGAESDQEQEPDSDNWGSSDDALTLGTPNGHEVIEFGGVLEWKVPIKMNCLADCSYVQRSREIPVSIARAKYPWIADKIVPQAAGPGGDDVDRLARINVALGVLDNFNTADSQVVDVTEQKTFLRPAELLMLEGADIDLDSILRRFPRGMYVTFVGGEYAESYNASIEEHVTLFFANPGDGMHRPGLGDWLVPIQDVLNNWLELANDYFVRGVPSKWMDNEMFDLEEVKNQVNLPGATHPFDREPGVAMTDVIFEETPILFPPELKNWCDDFKGTMAELLTGASPAMTGADAASATDTFGGMLVQRDQALGRQGLPWRQIKEGMGEVKRQAIQLLAQNQTGVVKLVGNESVVVELETMRGKFHAAADIDENIPASYTQKQNQLAKVFADAVTNPQLGELLLNPDNLDVFQRFGFNDLTFPMIESRDKQLGEIVELFAADPQKNPAVRQLEQEIAKLQAASAINVEGGEAVEQPDPQALAQAQTQIVQLQAQIQTLPPLVSSVAVRYFDDHETELYVCKKILNSPRGREMANGDDKEKAGYLNLELHAQAHEAKAAEAKAKNPAGAKPPSTSINIKDLPPKQAAALAGQANLPADVQDFEQQDVAEAAAKHPGPGGITGAAAPGAVAPA